MDQRPPRLAILLLPKLDHFARELVAGLPVATGWEVRGFRLASVADFRAALDWTDRPERDAVWFEFCWPPFPRLIAATAFAGRRVIVRVHRIEAMETDHVAHTPWHKVSDVVVVSRDMAARVRQAAPGLDATTRLHLIHNGLDLERFVPLQAWNPYRIGWCGLMTLRKNPTLALHILAELRRLDPRYTLHVCGQGGERLARESFAHLVRRLNLADAVRNDGTLPQSAMPDWHARNGVLLHTSLHESFGYAIAEAAAAGCDLAVLDHPGADEFWPEEMRFGTVAEAVAMVRAAAPHRWREHVLRRFALRRQIEATAMLLSGDPPRQQRRGVLAQFA
ncbi:MAG TPA: glycosyltransferase [Acetobacteraceae bacterium]|nr:glycosyltransferase [Acetobacteraceae bacterium]